VHPNHTVHLARQLDGRIRPASQNQPKAEARLTSEPLRNLRHEEIEKGSAKRQIPARHEFDVVHIPQVLDIAELDVIEAVKQALSEEC
jgi:hypothetical protein